jgi:hypothetical protein
MVKKKIALKSLITKMFIYSAIKIKAKVPLLYSVLNPDTNSDSPSAKSKGVRLVSASVVVNQTKARGIEVIIIGVQLFIKISVILYDIKITRIPRSVRDILTSYEIVCATPRIAPNRAYFEFEDHPAAKVVYTLILETHKKNNTPNLTKKVGALWG